MAVASQILSLNIGSQTIGLAEFRTQPHGGLVLRDYRLREIQADPMSDAIRQERIVEALREMMRELRIKRGQVNYAAAGQSVFARFVKLPSVEEEKIEKIIAFEAQQNVPFPIDEVVWDYQLVGGGGDEEIEVVLVAIKSDLLEDINGAVEQSRLRTGIVDVAPMALYNAFRYNYSDATGCSLLVDIGARTTNLLFIEPGKVFSRGVPIGGTSITAALAKEFGESFAAAEERKKNHAFVSLGGSYAEPGDPQVARASKIVRGTMTRLHGELMRSISHYRAQQQGNKPERIFLCGGSASTPYMREFFHEKLQVPIEFLNPLRNVAVAESASADELARSAHLLGELVGLGLRAVTACPMELNLRPASVIRAQELEKRRPSFMAAAACIVLLLFGWAAYYTRATQITDAATQQLQPKIKSLRDGEARFDKLRKQVASLDTVARPLISAVDERNFWLEILDDLNDRIPQEDIWITELIPMSGGKAIGVEEKRVTEMTPSPLPVRSARKPAEATGPAIDAIVLRGLYLFNPKQEQVVVDYFKNLVNSGYFAIDPREQARVIKSSLPNNTEWAYPYELHLDLRTPFKLP
jgi:type IV pilus assembly protein PilM